MKGTTLVLVTVVLLIGLALGSTLTYKFRATEGNGTPYSTLTLTAQSVYYYHGVLTCETVSGTAITAYVNDGATLGWTTIFNASLTATVYAITVTTTGAQSTFNTQGPTPICYGRTDGS